MVCSFMQAGLIIAELPTKGGTSNISLACRMKLASYGLRIGAVMKLFRLISNRNRLFSCIQLRNKNYPINLHLVLIFQTVDECDVVLDPFCEVELREEFLILL